jgi:predicted lipid-binding transport protein (Tim44 family)
VNTLLSAVFAVVVGFAIGIPDAEAAKRVGGGRSVGTQRDSVQQQAAPRPAQAPQAAPQSGAATAPAAAAKGSRWLGPVAGLLAGGLLGAMLFGGAFDGIKFMDVAMILLLVAGIFFIFRMMRKPQPQQQRSEPMQYAGVGADPRVEQQPIPQPYSAAPAASPVQPAANYFPTGFDAEAFARQAKQNFMRLQEANDRGELSALRDMMTPGLFKEIEAQVRERGGAAQKTEVVTLDSKVIEVVTEGDQYVASVRFTGMIKEDAGQPEHFSEVWHLQKPVNGSSGWLMAGIQQD